MTPTIDTKVIEPELRKEFQKRNKSHEDGNRQKRRAEKSRQRKAKRKVGKLLKGGIGKEDMWRKVNDKQYVPVGPKDMVIV